MDNTLEFINDFGNNVKVKLYQTRYVKNNAIAIVAKEDGLPYATATVNIEGAMTVTDNQVIMDTNNCGKLVDAMIDKGIVSEPISLIGSGFCVYPICKLLVDLPND